MGKIKHIGHMLKEKAALACFVLVAIALALTGCEQPDNTVNDYIITDDGTWEIYTAEGLLAWNAYVTNTKNYVPFTDDYGYSYYVVKTNAKLMADISLEGKSWTPVGYYNNVTYKEYYYAGTFDGKGHTISNLSIDLAYNNDSGLFGGIADTGEVKKLILKDVNISVNVDGNYYVGGIAGGNYGTIENCNVSGTVSGEYAVGGIAGLNQGTIENCSVSGTVEGQQYVGGIAGGNGNGTITACYNTGNVSGTSSVGGVVGDISWGTITACYNTGDVSGTSSIGGVIGSNSATVKACYWSVPDGSTTDYDGIGQGSGSATMVDGTKVTWDDAQLAMNEALSGYGYEYTKNTDSTTNDTMPLIIDTAESSN